MHVRQFVVLVLTAVATCMLAADVSGRWVLSLVATDGTEAPVVYVALTQEGEKLTGTCSLQELDADLTIAGRIVDDDVSWQCSSAEVRIAFTGSLNAGGSEMTGAWTTSANGRGTFTAKKQ